MIRPGNTCPTPSQLGENHNPAGGIIRRQHHSATTLSLPTGVPQGFWSHLLKRDPHTNGFNMEQLTDTIQEKNFVSEEKDQYAPEVCCHCEGAGCVYCNKTGSVMVLQPSRKCRHCNGDCCIYCGYTGWEHPLRE